MYNSIDKYIFSNTNYVYTCVAGKTDQKQLVKVLKITETNLLTLSHLPSPSNKYVITIYQ